MRLLCVAHVGYAARGVARSAFRARALGNVNPMRQCNGLCEMVGSTVNPQFTQGQAAKWWKPALNRSKHMNPSHFKQRITPPWG